MVDPRGFGTFPECDGDGPRNLSRKLVESERRYEANHRLWYSQGDSNEIRIGEGWRIGQTEDPTRHQLQNTFVAQSVQSARVNACFQRFSRPNRTASFPSDGRNRISRNMDKSTYRNIYL